MKSILVIDTPSSCSECSQCDKTIFREAHTEELYFECYAFKIEKQLFLETKNDFKTQRHPQCPLISIDIDELEGALENIKLHFDTCEEKICQVVNYDYNIDTIKSTIDKLGGK